MGESILQCGASHTEGPVTHCASGGGNGAEMCIRGTDKYSLSLVLVLVHFSFYSSNTKPLQTHTDTSCTVGIDSYRFGWSARLVMCK